MASGNTLLTFGPTDAILPASNYPQFVARNAHLVLAFDTTTQETCYFEGIMPQNYANTTGVTIILWWMAATATSGTIGYGVTFERMDAGTDLDADSFATEQGTAAAVTVSGTSGQPLSQTVTCAKGSTGMDSVVAGDVFRLRVRRDVANDTAAGDAQLIGIEIRET